MPCVHGARFLYESMVKSSPSEKPRPVHRAHLRNVTGSGLERQLLEELNKPNLRLPDETHHLIEDAGVRPDFCYRIAVYIGA